MRRSNRRPTEAVTVKRCVPLGSVSVVVAHRRSAKRPMVRVRLSTRLCTTSRAEWIVEIVSPWPWRRKGSREALRKETGDTKLPTLKLPDGTILEHSRAILGWVKQQP